MQLLRWAMVAVVGWALWQPAAAAESAAVIDARVNDALAELRATVPGAGEALDRARGVLVMPRVLRGGFIVGATMGEGALRVDGETVDYYTIAGASAGLLAGVEVSRHALLFMTDEALADFRAAPGSGWEVGATARVTVIDLGAQDRVAITPQETPIVAFVFGQQGLLAGVSLDGSRYTRVQR